MVRMARYLEFNRSLNSSADPAPRYTLPEAGARPWREFLHRRRVSQESIDSAKTRFSVPLICRGGGRILF